jgi:hypothetical protein
MYSAACRWLLMIEVVGSSETSVNFYESTGLHSQKTLAFVDASMRTLVLTNRRTVTKGAGPSTLSRFDKGFVSVCVNVLGISRI